MDSLAHLRQAAFDAKEAYLQTLQALVEHESPTADKTANDRLVDHLMLELGRDHWQLERVAQDHRGDQLIASKDASGTSTLLLCHFDTVWPVNTLATMPFIIEEDKVYGPGVLDMKAGICAAMHATRLLESLALPQLGKITLLLTSDEEVGSRDSRALIERLAKEHDRVFVLEPGRDDGAIKLGRKGVGDFHISFTGRSSHAGNHPEKGASALRELAHFLFFAENLNNPGTQTTVNATVAQAGSATNVIAEEATLTVDVRVLQAGEDERITEAIYGYEARDERVKIHVSGGINRPPLEPTLANKALFEEAKIKMNALGIKHTNIYQGAVVGGGSDGNFTSALGIPTLDGMGSVGAGPHARHEHIRLNESLERLALLSALLTP